MIIYLVENLIDGKVYVGKTSKKEKERFAEHVKLSSKKTTYFYRAIQKHGEENFRISRLQEALTDNVNEAESYWISFYRERLGVKNVYNETSGGDGGDTYTFNSNRKKAIQNLQMAQRKRFANPSEREWASNRSKEMWKKPEYREKIKKAMKKRWEAASVQEKKEHAKKSKKIWNDSTFRQSHQKSMKSFWKKNKCEMREKLSIARKASAKNKWNSKFGNNLELELKRKIVNGETTAQICKDLNISIGQLASILKLFFGKRTVNQVKNYAAEFGSEFVVGRSAISVNLPKT